MNNLIKPAGLPHALDQSVGRVGKGKISHPFK